MAETSLIEWTDATWNPVTGCSVVSPGCANCYAMRLAGTRLKHHPSREGLTTDSKAGPVWNGQVRLNEAWLTQPLGWKRGRRIFVCAHGDLFHEAVPDAWIDRVFAVMALAPQHTFQVLTKRAERMRAYLSEVDQEREDAVGEAVKVVASMMHPHDQGAAEKLDWSAPVGGCKPMIPLPNVWLGVSAERQQEAEERIPHLLETSAAIRFLSAEPLLGPLNLNRLHGHRDIEGGGDEHWWESCLNGKPFNTWAERDVPAPKLDWVIAGGESGPGARPMHPDWARQIRDDCGAADVPFFFKQWGAFAPLEAGAKDGVPDMFHVGKKAAGRLLDGVLHNAFPNPTS